MFLEVLEVRVSFGLFGYHLKTEQGPFCHSCAALQIGALKRGCCKLQNESARSLPAPNQIEKKNNKHKNKEKQLLP